MELPTKPQPPLRKEPKSLLLYGKQKIGKTTTLAQLPNNLIIDLEKGTESVTAMRVTVESLNELSKVIKKIMNKEKSYDFITIDTVTKLETWCEKAAFKEYKDTPKGKKTNASTLFELDYGLGYGLLRNKFREILDVLKDLPCTIILCAHVKDKYVSVDNDEVKSCELDLVGKIKSLITSNVDSIGYLYQDSDNSNQRKLTFETKEEIICGNRYSY